MENSLDNIHFQAENLDILFESIKKEVQRVGDCSIAVAELPTTEDSETQYCATITYVKEDK